MNLVSSFKRLVWVLVFLVIVTLVTVLVFNHLIAPVELSQSLANIFRTAIVLVFGASILILIRHSKSHLEKRIGEQPATVFQFFMVLGAVIVMIFAVLRIFEVIAPTTLILSGGAVSIVIGLALSVFVGNILAGTLVLMTHAYRVGDNVIVNNVPGKIVEITNLVTKIMNDVGGLIIIPNTALAQGGVIITKVADHEKISPVRLPYDLGDRVFTTYMSGEGVVKELTPYYTKVLLDSGRELTFLNNSVLIGSVAVAKISGGADDTLKFTFRIGGGAEKTIKSIKNVARSNPTIFKSVPTVLYSSLDERTVELEISCKVDPIRKSEAKDIILKTAYSSKSRGLLR
jgi:small-conductance mechanosensitive channel